MNSNSGRSVLSGWWVGCVFAVMLVIYGLTLAPTVTLIDSGELILAADSLGVGHPPGFPTYLMLANLATRWPWGEVAWRVNAFSAFCGAAAAAGVAWGVWWGLALPSVFGRNPQSGGATTEKSEKKKKKNSGREKEAGSVAANVAVGSSPTSAGQPEGVRESSWERLLIAVSIGLLFGLARTPWSYATVAEVYALNSLMIAGIFGLLVSWRVRALEARAERREVLDGRLFWAAGLFGLSLGVHLVTAGLMFVAYSALVLGTEGRRFFAWRRLGVAAVIAFAGLAVYGYLPIAAAREPLFAWGNPNDWESFWNHVTGRQYRVNLLFSLGRISEFLRLVAREFGVVWMPLTLGVAGLGLVRLWRRERVMFAALTLAIAAAVGYGLFYEIAEDKDAYYLPAFLSLAVAAGFGLQGLAAFARSTRWGESSQRVLVALGALVLPSLAVASNYPFCDRSEFWVGRDYAENLLRSVESGALLLTNDWQADSPLLYLQHVENARPDVAVVNVNQLRRSWYFDFLARTRPALVASAREEIERFRADLEAWERDPSRFERDPALGQRIDDRFYGMILALLERHAGNGPVYVTQGVVSNSTGRDERLTRAILEGYPLVPIGLVYRLDRLDLRAAPAAEVRSEPTIQTRGLALKGPDALRLAPEDVVHTKVAPVYVQLFVDRGRYLALGGLHLEAIAWFDRALALAPDDAQAIEQRSASVAALATRSTITSPPSATAEPPLPAEAPNSR